MSDHLPRKDWEQQPVAPIWRGAIASVVSCLANHDFELSGADVSVVRPSTDAAEVLSSSVASYGDVAIAELPEVSWDSSVAMWSGGYWEALVDLWTVEEGRSDLVLSLEIRESDCDYVIEVYGIYVP